MSPKKLVIAIDGPAASGKSTTARHVAEKLGYTYIDTGAMYRAVTLAVLRSNIDPADRQAVEAVAAQVSVDLVRDPDGGAIRTLLDGEDVSMAIRTPEVTAHVSIVSSYAGVRKHLVALQQSIARDGGVVLDGRDIGTVVFPNADVKVFMVANVSERAVRRYAELQQQGTDVSLGGLEQDIAARDHFDSTREISPLRKADDAVVVDTSGMTIEDQVTRVLELVDERLKAP